MAKKAGAYKGRKPSLTAEQLKLWQTGVNRGPRKPSIVVL
jgi:hypothetical protein